MPGTRCAVGVCTNSRNKTKKTGEDIVYHSFPKEKKRCAVWMRRCRRYGKWNPKSSHICSKHFREEDYKRDLKSELLNMPIKKILSETAIPSLFLKPNSVEETVSKREERIARRNSKKLVLEILKEASISETINTPKRKKLTIGEIKAVLKSKLNEELHINIQAPDKQQDNNKDANILIKTEPDDIDDYAHSLEEVYIKDKSGNLHEIHRNNKEFLIKTEPDDTRENANSLEVLVKSEREDLHDEIDIKEEPVFYDEMLYL